MNGLRNTFIGPTRALWLADRRVAAANAAVVLESTPATLRELTAALAHRKAVRGQMAEARELAEREAWDASNEADRFDGGPL